jgi:hypothetical protein
MVWAVLLSIAIGFIWGEVAAVSAFVILTLSVIAVGSFS